MAIDFGFKKLDSGAINLDRADTALASYLRSKEPSYAICINCGTCTATCSAGTFTDFNLRRIMLLAKRGENQELSDLVSKCMLCGKCQLACPKGVNTRNIILNINRFFYERTL